MSAIEDEVRRPFSRATALVTGGASGIGLATASLLSVDGGFMAAGIQREWRSEMQA